MSSRLGINMSISITQAAPDSPEAVALIEELESHLQSFGYPQESRHGFSVEKLIREGVAFFIIREDGKPVGCGGIKLFGTEYGELKRMYIRPSHQGKGLGRQMLHHLGSFVRQHLVELLRLETGIHQVPAIKLYEAFGFQRCGPFGEYREDPVSVYMEMPITSDQATAKNSA